MGIAIFGFLCIVLGGTAGAFAGAYFARRRDRAPAPVDLSYDADNPINGRYNAGKRVTVNGAEWTVYGGQPWSRD